MCLHISILNMHEISRILGHAFAFSDRAPARALALEAQVPRPTEGGHPPASKAGVYMYVVCWKLYCLRASGL